VSFWVTWGCSLAARVALWAFGLWLAAKLHPIKKAIQQQAKGFAMPKVKLLLSVNAPPGLELTYAGVVVGADPAGSELSLNVVEGGTAVFPWSVRVVSGTPGPQVVTTSIDDPQASVGTPTAWTDGVNPSNIAAADLAAGPVSGLHSIVCPATAPVGEVVGINFSVQPVAV